MERVVYTEGTWDLLHYNHLEMLNEALKFGDRLVVGVVADEWVSTYKKAPVLNQDERLRTISALGMVSEAFILHGPFVPKLMTFLIEKYKPVAVAYGSGGFDDYFQPAVDLGIMRRLSYRPGITTTEIVNRILRTRQ